MRSAEGHEARLPELAAELIRSRIDVLVASLTPAALAAKAATRNIPIVMAPAGEPVRTGLVASLARPGGNVTGAWPNSVSNDNGTRLDGEVVAHDPSSDAS
jgi:putative ABC transport system substrate-binding protein